MTQELTDTSSVADPRAGVMSWLSDISVSAVGPSIPVATAAAVLEQFGARVTRVVDIDDVVGGSDIVLVDRVADHGGRSPVDYVRRVGQMNAGVWVTVSAYGLRDPRAAVPASEVTLLAAGGILGHTPGPDGTAPTIPAGNVALKLVGNVAAMSALHGLHEFHAKGEPVHIDLSGQGAIVATGLALEMSHALNECPSVGGAARYGAPSGFFACRDGAVYVLVLEQHQWDGFRSVLAPAIDDIATVDESAQRPDEVNAALAAWTAGRTVAECESILQGAGVPCATVHSIESFLDASEAAGRPNGRGVALPAGIRPLGGDVTDGRGVIALDELKVLDSGHVLAVPLSASWLGAMGAQVVKAEDPRRLDIYRRRGPFAHGEPGLDRSAYFNHLNFSKRGIDVTVDASGSSLDIEPFDVVMHNLSPHRASLIGVSPSDVGRARGPKLSLVSSGFGRSGPWSDYRAYGTTIHAFAGLISATRNARGEMSGIGTPWADPLASVVATIWVLAWSLAPHKEQSIGVDVSMADALASHMLDQIGVEAEENYVVDEFGGDFFLGLPESGRDLAVSIGNAVQAAAFAEVVGSPVPRLARRGERVDLPHGPLDGVADSEVEARLQAAGVPASLVYTADDLARDKRLFDTEVFQYVESVALGRYAVCGLPWSVIGVTKRPLQAAPERA